LKPTVKIEPFTIVEEDARLQKHVPEQPLTGSIVIYLLAKECLGLLFTKGLPVRLIYTKSARGAFILPTATQDSPAVVRRTSRSDLDQ
jgi:hypothetical protein